MMSLEVFTHHFLVHRSALLRIARWWRVTPEDVVQDLYVHLLQSGKDGRPRYERASPENISGFLAVCLVRLLQTNHRRPAPPTSLKVDWPADEDDTPERVLQESWQSLREVLETLVERLTAREQQALLANLRGEGRQEAANRLGWTQPQYDGALCRARREARLIAGQRGVTLPRAQLADARDLLVGLLTAEVGPEETAENSQVTAPAWTHLLKSNQQERLQRILDEHDVFSQALQWVGVDVAEAPRFRNYVHERSGQLNGSRRFREAMACWVSEFAHTHNLPLARPLTPEEWPGLIERCVLVTSLKSIPEGEPTWARDFRDHALSQQVSTVGELKMLEVPEEIRSQAGFVDFRRDLIKQLQQRQDKTKLELEMSRGG